MSINVLEKRVTMRVLILMVSVLVSFSCGGEDIVDSEFQTGVNSVQSGQTVKRAESDDQFSVEKTPFFVVKELFSFVEIAAGSFTMGSPDSEPHRDTDEGQVEVEITKPFEMMRMEVTQSQWFSVMRENPSYFNNSEYCDNYDDVNEMCPDHPVEQVSWNDVQIFISKLNEGLSGCDGTPKSDKGCYRLPTEAEWEYAARAGSRTAYFFGDDVSELEDYAWYEDNSEERTHKVGTKNPNFWGLHDMYGNVWEWTQDSYQEYLPGEKDPLVTRTSFRMIRGGGWPNSAKDVRTALRLFNFRGGVGHNGIGFRLVKTL